MTTTTYTTRLFGGHDIGVTYDNIAGTLSILGQSITISTLPAPLQAAWSNVLVSGVPAGPRGAFGSDNLAQVVGAILDSQPTWRNAAQAALAGFLQEQISGGIASPETWNRQ